MYNIIKDMKFRIFFLNRKSTLVGVISFFILSPLFGQIPPTIPSPVLPTLPTPAYPSTGINSPSLFSPNGLGNPLTPSSPQPETGWTPLSPGGNNPATIGTGSIPTKASSSVLLFGAVASSLASLMPYDPILDNHLKAPSKPMGLFGRPIKEVEQILKTFGAKPYSYAFGKYSRMCFSVYVLTLNFDRYRKLGTVEIEPIPPFSKVEPQAQAFFSRLFLSGADLGQFSTSIQPMKMLIAYEGLRSLPEKKPAKKEVIIETRFPEGFSSSPSPAPPKPSYQSNSPSPSPSSSGKK